jgi:hypothetical protein
MTTVIGKVEKGDCRAGAYLQSKKHTKEAVALWFSLQCGHRLWVDRYIQCPGADGL